MAKEKIAPIKTEPVLPPGDAHPSVLDTPPPRPTQTSRIANKIIIVALLVIAISLGTMFYWATQDDTVLDVKKQPFPTRTIRQHPTAGGVVFLTVDYCKKHDVEGDLRVSFVSQTREIFLPISKERSPKGCLVNREIPILIPKEITPDTYKVKLRITYNVNPLKKGIVEEYYSQDVIIDPTTPGNGLPANSFPGQQ